MKKILVSSLLLLFSVQSVYADDSTIQNGLQFLRAKQDATGKITTGFSAPSQWSALAFTINNIDTKTVKSSDTSLYDFLLTDIPTNDTATEWETRILAIVAIGGNPYNFNGTNYVAHLESFYNANQLGDTCSLNDDIFGLLALISAGSSSSAQIKQDTLNYLISKQDTTDGGFGFSAPGCTWYSTSADMTGATLQALIAAKNSSLTNPNLDTAITKTENYLVTNQDTDGGFGYFGSSDADTTGWVVLGLNAAGLQDSDEAKKAKAYLLSQQSSSDGGFMAYDYGANAMLSNASTTAQAIIALSGKTWILQIFTPQSSSSAQTTIVTTTPSPTTTPTPTTTQGLTSIGQPTVLYQTITITTTPSPKKVNKKITPQPTSTQVLGETQHISPTPTKQTNTTKTKTITVLGSATKNPAYLAIAVGAFCLMVLFLLRSLLKTNRY